MKFKIMQAMQVMQVLLMAPDHLEVCSTFQQFLQEGLVLREELDLAHLIVHPQLLIQPQLLPRLITKSPMTMTLMPQQPHRQPLQQLHWDFVR